MYPTVDLDKIVRDQYLAEKALDKGKLQKVKALEEKITDERRIKHAKMQVISESLANKKLDSADAIEQRAAANATEMRNIGAYTKEIRKIIPGWSVTAMDALKKRSDDLAKGTVKHSGKAGGLVGKFFNAPWQAACRFGNELKNGANQQIG